MERVISCLCSSNGRRSQKEGGIAMALQHVVSAHRKAFIGALRCVYLLNHQEIAHTTTFMPLGTILW